ncbi:hypothetical protein [Teredinibacter franksiae]|uniref:hypothetical protein n=1 Tax=Teredinibacter franksiae TaxID=2761453 RepID=UPI00162A0FF4|nr:hypothetical protein [Teredinibacter franksiae]
MLFDNAGKTELAVGNINLYAQAENESVEAYVTALNELLNRFSVELSGAVSAVL